MLLSSANTAHTINTAPNPDQNARPEVLPISSAGKKAAIVIPHHGKRKPDANDRMRMIRNSIVAPSEPIAIGSSPEGWDFIFLSYIVVSILCDKLA
jgi:hypothetical protein